MALSTAWGDDEYGGRLWRCAPAGKGYVQIYATGEGAFAALDDDGYITAWGVMNMDYGAPAVSGYVQIYSLEFCSSRRWLYQKSLGYNYGVMMTMEANCAASIIQ